MHVFNRNIFGHLKIHMRKIPYGLYATFDQSVGDLNGTALGYGYHGHIYIVLFDKDPELIGKTIRGIEIMPMEEMERFVRENDIEIAVLTLPKTSAVGVADKLAQNGIKAIWNFAHVDLNLPKEIQVENVHLSDSLMKLSYNLTRYRKEQEE